MTTFLTAIFMTGTAFAQENTQITTSSNKNQPILLVYHTIAPPVNTPETKTQKQYHVYPEVFRAQMQYLKDNNYVPIPMKVYLRSLERSVPLPKKSVVITFDDGWKNQYDYALPVLKEFGYPATFYILTGSVGARSYLNWDQVRELDQLGMDITAHTVSHKRLTQLNDEALVKELAQSKQKLEQEIGHRITMLAYPYYNHDDRVRKFVEQAGYAYARAGWTGKQNSLETRFMLQSQESVNNPNPFASVRSVE